MAGDWIKMTHALPEKPEVLAIAGKTGLTRFDVVGRLFILWRWFDNNTTDGNAVGVTPVTLDECLFGYSANAVFVPAVLAVGWLEDTGEGIRVVKFDEHISESAKVRAQTAKRVAKSKANGKGNAQGNADGVTGSVTKTVPREEKRREEESSPSLRSGEGTPKASAISLNAYLERCRAEGRKPIPQGHPVRAYCQDAGITDDMLQVAWLVFKDRHTNGQRSKRYKDWPRVFQNSVESRWYGLWVVNPQGLAEWSSTGLQQKRVLESRMSRQEEVAHAPE